VRLVAEQQAATLNASAAGPAAFVPTRSYLRNVVDSPNDALHHWHENAETYLEVGEAAGLEMLRLLGGAST
jgi:hypothetical protein